MVEGIIDTSLLIDYLRGYPPAQIWFAQMGFARFAITPIVWMEVVQGSPNKDAMAKSVKLLSTLQLEHPTEGDMLWTIQQLEAFMLSHGIQYSDILIASAAARLSVPLCTINKKHYAPLLNVDERRPCS